MRFKGIPNNFVTAMKAGLITMLAVATAIVAFAFVGDVARRTSVKSSVRTGCTVTVTPGDHGLMIKNNQIHGLTDVVVHPDTSLRMQNNSNSCTSS